MDILLAVLLANLLLASPFVLLALYLVARDGVKCVVWKWRCRRAVGRLLREVARAGRVRVCRA